MPRLTFAPGTHAIGSGLLRKGGWFLEGADTPAFFQARGIRCSYFRWQTGLAGYEFWRPLLGLEPQLGDWEVPAENLLERYQPEFVDPIHWPAASRIHMLAHSHGAQPILIACALGLRINVLITVGSPVRCDVLDVYGARARANIGYHLHYYAEGDRVQFAGGLGDGRFGVLRDFNYSRDGRLIYRCDETVVLPCEAGHTGLLTQGKYRGELLTAVQHILDRDGRDDLLSRQLLTTIRPT